MAESLTVDLFSGIETKPRYLLTSARHLLRILDQGLIVPDLVGQTSEGGIANFEENQLSLVWQSGTPLSRPALIEINNSEIDAGSIPLADVSRILFKSKDEYEDLLCRGYENVPFCLFKFDTLPESKLIENSTIRAEFFLPKLDQRALSKKYRHFDSAIAGINYLIFSNKKENEILETIKAYCNSDFRKNIESISSQLASQFEKSDPTTPTIISTYLKVLIENEGNGSWVREQIIDNFVRALPDNLSSREDIAAWSSMVKDISRGIRDMPVLNDEKNIVLRAILLHIQNPDENSINRMKESPSAPGEAVSWLAGFFAAWNYGYASLLAEEKINHPGLFFLYGEIISGWINKKEASLDHLYRDTDDVNTKLYWREKFMLDCIRETISPSVEENDQGCTELEKPGLVEYAQNSKLVASIINSNKQGIALKLRADLLMQLPKNTRIALAEQQLYGASLVTMKVKIIDLKVKSQKERLTKEKAIELLKLSYSTKDVLRIKMDNSSVYLEAIACPIETLSQDYFDETLSVFINSLISLKSNKKKGTKRAKSSSRKKV
ncbi:hypothetical protein HCH_05711 [Hahella chejuensis KCTC 2396]|uniref:Uncharacterized protein n=1 Tax=Hahella chejuensis (strain KCTC 2396) TaxID=349521 RepID=Q2SAF7_HAHCH|nr:hypothetical protein [Hahella chejuensis]ABC32367.1 hypothetical protein HCH_05711 [Hahella chejuensis KCTC 2396]